MASYIHIPQPNSCMHFSSLPQLQFGPLIFSSLIMYRGKILWSTQIMNCLIMWFSKVSWFFVLLTPKYHHKLPSLEVLHTPFTWCKGTSSTRTYTYKNKQKKPTFVCNWVFVFRQRTGSQDNLDRSHL